MPGADISGSGELKRNVIKSLTNLRANIRSSNINHSALFHIMSKHVAGEELDQLRWQIWFKSLVHLRFKMSFNRNQIGDLKKQRKQIQSHAAFKENLLLEQHLQ